MCCTSIGCCSCLNLFHNNPTNASLKHFSWTRLGSTWTKRSLEHFTDRKHHQQNRGQCHTTKHNVDRSGGFLNNSVGSAFKLWFDLIVSKTVQFHSELMSFWHLLSWAVLYHLIKGRCYFVGMVVPVLIKQLPSVNSFSHQT